MPVSEEVLSTCQPQPPSDLLESCFEGMTLNQPEEQQPRRTGRNRVPSQKVVEAASTAVAGRGRGRSRGNDEGEVE